MTTIQKTLVYGGVWIPATVIAAMAESATIEGVNSTGARWVGWPVILALNVVPAIICGLAVYVPAAQRLNRDRVFGGWSGHFVRTAILYALVVACGALTATGWSSPDFGMVAQLLLWPGIVAACGIVADLATWLPSRERKTGARAA